MRTIVPALLAAVNTAGKKAVLVIAKFGLVLAFSVAIFLLGAGGGICWVAKSAPLHTLAGQSYLPVGDYEVVSIASVGSITVLTLMDSDLRFFVKRLPTEAIRQSAPDGKMLLVRQIGASKTFSIENSERTVIGTKGPSYIANLNNMLSRGRELALVIKNDEGKSDKYEDLPLPPPPPPLAKTQIKPVENE